MPNCKNCDVDISEKKDKRTIFCTRSCANKFNLPKIKTGKDLKKKRDADTARTKRHRLALKLKAVEYKGGECCKCGYNNCIQALDFHHVNEVDKSFNISRATTKKMPWKKIKIELDKCILVCANCHREIHSVS